MAFFEFPHTRTYDSDLGWLIKDYGKLEASVKTLEDCCAGVQERLEALEEIMNALQDGKLPDQVRDAIIRWLTDHAKDLIGDLIAHMVVFGLTESGYFYAAIPDSWSDITFKTTGYDITLALQPEYGHLVLLY